MERDEMRKPILHWERNFIGSSLLAGLAAAPATVHGRPFARVSVAYPSTSMDPLESGVSGERLEALLERVDARLEKAEERGAEDEGGLDYSREELSQIRRFFADATISEAEDAHGQGRLTIDGVLEMTLESLENSGAIAARAVAEAAHLRRVIDRNARLIDEQQARIRQAIVALVASSDA